jgi:hypothetical protein
MALAFGGIFRRRGYRFAAQMATAETIRNAVVGQIAVLFAVPVPREKESRRTVRAETILSSLHAMLRSSHNDRS